MEKGAACRPPGDGSKTGWLTPHPFALPRVRAVRLSRRGAIALFYQRFPAQVNTGRLSLTEGERPNFPSRLDFPVRIGTLRPMANPELRPALTGLESDTLTGNNGDLARSLARTLTAEHVSITEFRRRTMGTIVLDVLLGRTPKITMPVTKSEGRDLVVFVGPAWMGRVATPFRACFNRLGPEIGKYAFVSASGGADGPNPKLAGELKKRLGKEPVSVVDLHIADLLPPEPKPTRKVTMAYRISEIEAKQMADTVESALYKAVLSAGKC
jgi:hypothetical protein